MQTSFFTKNQNLDKNKKTNGLFFINILPPSARLTIIQINKGLKIITIFLLSFLLFYHKKKAQPLLNHQQLL